MYFAFEFSDANTATLKAPGVDASDTIRRQP
jgi:hypothetical protein